MGAQRQSIGADNLTVVVDDVGFGSFGLVAALDDDLLAQAARFVGVDAIGHVLDKVLIVDVTGDFADDNGVEGIPFTDDVAFADFVAGAEIEFGTVWDVGRGKHHFRCRIDNAHFSHTADDDFDVAAFGIDFVGAHGAELVDFEHTVVARRCRRYGGDIRGHTTDVEGLEGKLRARLTDRLGGNDADSLALLNHTVGGKVAAVALGADAALALAGENRTDLDALDGRCLDFLDGSFGYLVAGGNDELAGGRIDNIMDADTAENALAEAGHDFVVVLDFGADEAAERSAVLFVDDDVVGHVDQTAGQITGVGGLQGGIGQTLSGTVGRDEILEHTQALLEVRQNRVLDDLAAFGAALLGLGHKAAHTRELTDLVFRTTGARVEHHEHRVEAFLVGADLLHQSVGQAGVDMCPDIDYLVIALVVGYETHRMVLENLLNLLVAFAHIFFFLLRDEHVAEVERNASLEGHVVAEVLDVVEELGRTRNTARLDDARDDCAQRFLRQNLVDIADLLRNIMVDKHAAHRGVLYEMLVGLAVLVDVVDNDADRSVKRHAAFVVGDLSLFGAVELQALTLVAGAELGDIIETEHHILRRNGDRRAVGGVENVVRAEHEDLGFEHSLVTEGKMDSHLVTVEVGVESRTGQRVKLDCLTLD